MQGSRAVFFFAFAGALGCATEHRGGDASAGSASSLDAEQATALADGGDAGGDLVNDERDAAVPEAAVSTEPIDAGLGDAGDSGAMVEAGGLCMPAVASLRRSVPEIMLVLDRSQSMAAAIPDGVNCQQYDVASDQLACLAGDMAACDRAACTGIDCTQPPYRDTVVCGGTNASPSVDRWTPTVQAVKQLTQSYQMSIGFGLTLFPAPSSSPAGDPDGGTQDEFCSPGTQLVAPGANTAAAIAETLDRTQPAGATPTAATLTTVLQQRQARLTSSGADIASQVVLLATDGQPTCPNARGSTVNAEGLAMDHAATLQALSALREAGVKTYVFGYRTSLDPSLERALTEFAVQGGTDQFRGVHDAQSIVMQFAEIAELLVSCSYQLDKAPADATQLLVVLDGQDVEMGSAGWSLEGANLTFHGRACTKLNDGQRHQVRATIVCRP